MRLSKLQKFILVQCWSLKKKETSRREFLKFYFDYKGKKPNEEDQQDIITKSLMRMIHRDLIVGLGRITGERVFVDRVKLTRLGRREVRRLLDKQQRLPLKMGKRRKLKTKN